MVGGANYGQGQVGGGQNRVQVQQQQPQAPSQPPPTSTPPNIHSDMGKQQQKQVMQNQQGRSPMSQFMI